MSLRLKINLIVGALTLGFVIAVLALQFRGLRDSVYEETEAASRVAAQFLDRTAQRYAAQGTPVLMAFLQSIGRVRSNDITLFDADGKVAYVSPPSPYKAGRSAPAWFSSLILPMPSLLAINFPDGRLEVRSNASRSVIDAWDNFAGLALVGLALLVLVNALVFWVVGRTVRPFGQVVRALDTLQAGRFDVILPPLPGTEAAAIGAAFNRMVSVLQQNIETERRASRAERELSDNRELTRYIDHHIEQERRMIARELHDELGQSVTAMRSMALSVAQRMRGVDATSEQAAQLIAQESSRLYDAMHGLIPRLTPLVLDSFGLADALRDLAQRTRSAHPGVQMDLSLQLGEVDLDSDAALALYRAAQEGITNSLRHGQAGHLKLSVQARDGGVHLELVDDGVGLAPDWSQRQGHYGLRWLGERVEALGGRFDLAAVEPRGVALNVHLPPRQPAASTAPNVTVASLLQGHS